jgi:hypothetical protein
MTLPEIITEMRSYSDPHSDPWKWADGLEAAIREKDAEIERLRDFVQDAFGEGYRRGGRYPPDWEFDETYYDQWEAANLSAALTPETKP